MRSPPEPGFLFRMTDRQFDVSPEMSELLLELSDKSRQLSAAIQSDASMLQEIVNVDLTDDLKKRMKNSESLSEDLIQEIGDLQKKIKKLDKRFKKII